MSDICRMPIINSPCHQVCASCMPRVPLIEHFLVVSLFLTVPFSWRLVDDRLSNVPWMISKSNLFQGSDRTRDHSFHSLPTEWADTGWEPQVSSRQRMKFNFCIRQTNLHRANLALVRNNARIGADIAVELAKLRSPSQVFSKHSSSSSNESRGPLVVGGSIFDFVVRLKEGEVSLRPPPPS